VLGHRPQWFLHTYQTHTPHVRSARARACPLYLAVCISCTPISSTFEEKVERGRSVALPMVPESRLHRTVRGPGTPTADAALESVATRRPARCRQLPERL
jgi:hypothetical protein